MKPVDEIIAEVSHEWATGKWTSIGIDVAEIGNPNLGWLPCANRHGINGLEDGQVRRELKKAIKRGYVPAAIVAVKDGEIHLLPLTGSGFSVGKDSETGEEYLEQREWTGKPSQYN